MVLPLLTLQTVALHLALFSAWLLLTMAWRLTPALELGSLRFIILPLGLILPLVVLLLIHRQFLELQTLRTLAWVTIALVCVYLLDQVSWFIWPLVVAEQPTSVQGRLYIAVFSPYVFWPALFLGVLAGLRWPDKLLVPIAAPHRRQELRIMANIGTIVVMAYLGGVLMHLTESSMSLLPWPLYLGVLISFFFHLLIFSLLMTLSVKWNGFTGQVRAVILCGLSALGVKILLNELTIASMGWLVLFGYPDRALAEQLSRLNSSLITVGWIGVTLAIWAGMRWPERLLLPSRLSGGTQRVRLFKNVAAITACSLLALLVYDSSINFLV